MDELKKNEQSPEQQEIPGMPPKRSFWRRNGATIITVAILGLIIGGAIAINQHRNSDTLDKNDVSVLTSPNATSTATTTTPSVTTSTTTPSNVSSNVKTPVAVTTPTTTTSGTVGSGVTTTKPSTSVLGSASASIQNDRITVTAVRGEGRTHLARRAITQELKATNTTLSAEQRVYAEDYLMKKSMPKTSVHTGTQVSYSVSEVNAAISAAQHLSTAQINHLHQFAVHVNFTAAP